ncbi:homocysteine S-methyltransferase family protein [Acuticoccus sp.]|uniref:homocysteine S-methyltransferase family protein n=1 Tax=Acuticoccus sp. TaxID=1904378 RepID=UPI003B51647E
MTIRLLDGGMGQELYRRAGRPPAGWSVFDNVTRQDDVRTLHEEFLAAGADVITTNTYGAGRHKLNLAGAPERFAEVNRAACSAAEAARDRVNPAALIAGALGPLRGSYQPDAVPPSDLAEAEYAEQALVLAPHVDLFICETMTMGREARAAARAAASTGRPVWVAFTLHEDGSALRSDEPVRLAVRALQDVAVDAVLFNCTSPEAVGRALPELVAASAGRAVGGYANGFEAIPAEYGHGKSVADLDARQEMTPDAYAEHVAAWLDAGATIVGGCCEVGPAHIARVKVLIGERQ